MIAITANHVLGTTSILAVLVATWNAWRMAKLTGAYVDKTAELVDLQRKQTDALMRDRHDAERAALRADVVVIARAIGNPAYGTLIEITNRGPHIAEAVVVEWQGPPDNGFMNYPDGITILELDPRYPFGVHPRRIIGVGHSFAVELSWADGAGEHLERPTVTVTEAIGVA